MKRLMIMLMLVITTVSFSKKEWSENGKDYLYQECQNDREYPEQMGIYKKGVGVLIFNPRRVDYDSTLNMTTILVKEHYKYDFSGMRSADCSVYEKDGKTMMITEANGMIIFTMWDEGKERESTRLTKEAIRFLNK